MSNNIRSTETLWETTIITPLVHTKSLDGILTEMFFSTVSQNSLILGSIRFSIKRAETTRKPFNVDILNKLGYEIVLCLCPGACK